MSDKLPVIREDSTAKSTSFCSARLDGPGGLHLFFDGNGKITAENGTLLEPRPNAFSLAAASVENTRAGDPQFVDEPPSDHCPGSTNACRASCYVDGLAKAQPELYSMYEHNSATMRRILDDGNHINDPAYWSLADDWVLHVADWIKKNAAGGFRWHVSGDVFSLQYARWIADVVRESALVRHWIYTRSFQFAAPLAEVATYNGGNLSLNFSCDRDNYIDAVGESTVLATDGGKGPRLCYLVADAAERIPPLLDNDVIFPDYPLRLGAKTFEESAWWQALGPGNRGRVCPVDARGKAENRRCGLGANQCGRCLK